MMVAELFQRIKKRDAGVSAGMKMSRGDQNIPGVFKRHTPVATLHGNQMRLP
jgi:hypothetical protein